MRSALMQTGMQLLSCDLRSVGAGGALNYRDIWPVFSIFLAFVSVVICILAVTRRCRPRGGGGGPSGAGNGGVTRGDKVRRRVLCGPLE